MTSPKRDYEYDDLSVQPESGFFRGVAVGFMITVLDGIAGPFVRGHIARLRQNGKLQEILGAPSRVGECGVVSSLVGAAPVSARPPDAPASAVTHRTDAGGQE